MPRFRLHTLYAFLGPRQVEATVGQAYYNGGLPRFESRIFRARVNRRGDGCELDDLREWKWDRGNIILKGEVRPHVGVVDYGKTSASEGGKHGC